MTLLVETPHGAVRNLLPDGRDAADWHPALAAEIAGHLSPAHAAILATPVPVGNGTRWETSASQAIRQADLSAADRHALMRAVTVILSDIRRLAESGAAVAVTRCWPMLREIPDFGMIFAADGRPVLAGWGGMPPSMTMPPELLADADDNRPWQPQPQPPWQLYAGVAAVLAVFALVSGLLLSRLAIPPASLQACVADPDEVAALNQQAQTDGRHSALQSELALLVQQEGSRRLQCPLPVIASVPPLRHAEATPPALPGDRWDRHDLTMLDGCWNRISNMAVHNPATDTVLPVASWRICFDGNGVGTQTMTLQNGGRCTGPVVASFDGNRMITRAAQCRGPGLSFVRSEQDCTRVSDDEASCIGRDLEGSAVGRASPASRFRR
jgi:hypothetical protein